jgi:hypothetical protein
MTSPEILLKNLRENRLKSYQATPGDIEEHRRAELRVAGDTAGRPMIELIQNADDAMNQSPNSDDNRVKIILKNNRLLVANAGEPFSDAGVEAICNLDRSPKKDRRITIGNKGIGFKSVLTWSITPIIHSETYEFTFDREKSADEISKALNRDYHAELVPLMRLPFKPENRDDLAKQLYQEGFVTVIILPLRNEAVSRSILEELNNFNPLTLLFLNSIADLSIVTDDFERQYCVFREKDEINIDVDGSSYKYRIFRDEKEISKSISFTLPEDCRDLTHSAISIAIPETPLESNYQLFSHFPTSEKCPFKFYIHGDFIVDAGRKHLRGDAKTYNEWVIKEIAILFVNKTLPYFGKNNPLMVDFLECRSPDDMESIEKQIFDVFVGIISKTEFLPAMFNQSRLVSPATAGLAKEETINDVSIMFEDEIEWNKRFLIEPAWADKARLETIIKFGGKEIKKPDFVKILGSLARPDPEWCTNALNIILKWKANASTWWISTNESADDIANALKEQNLFLTTKLGLRSLSSDEAAPLFLPPAEGKTINIPSIISLDFLNLELGKNLGKPELATFRKRLEELSKYGLHPFQPRDIIQKAVLPAIQNAEPSRNFGPSYKKDLLVFLAQLQPNENKFEDTDPYPWFNELRTQLALKVCVPTENGDWLPGYKVYASKQWESPDELIEVYKNSKNSNFLMAIDDDVHNGIPIEKWKSLYRYLGVSWEPKILPIEEEPEWLDRYSFPNPHCNNVSEEDWEQYKIYYRDSDKLSDMWRWTIKLEESYSLDDWKNIKHDASKCLNLLHLLYKTEAFNYIAGPEKDKALCRFKYTKISCSYSAHCTSILVWGIKHSAWLPSTSGKLLSPDKIYLEDSEIGKGLKHILPVLPIKRPKEKELRRRLEDLIDEIGIKATWDQITIEDWNGWLNDLSEQETEISKEKIRTAQILYRHCLERCNVSENTNPFSGNKVLSLSQINQYAYRKAKEVVYLDEPHFDTIKKKLIDCGYSLFVLEMGGENRARRAKNLFGMTLISEIIDEEVMPGKEVPGETEEWQRRFERISPVILARLSNDRPESRPKDEEFFRSLKVLVVKELKKKYKLFHADNWLFEEKPSACWSSSDNTLYLNADSEERGLWSGLAESLAQRLGQTYYEAFENLLLCESDSEQIEKLRRAGVSEDDVLYCQRALKEEATLPVVGIGKFKENEIEEKKPIKEEQEDEEVTEGPGKETVEEQILEASEGVFGEPFQEESGRDGDVIKERPEGGQTDSEVDRTPSDRELTTPREVSQAKKDKVELSAMNWVERYEKKHNREPKDVSQHNLGYDIESNSPLSGEKRYIEVKGAWRRPEKREVTINEWRKAIELGEKYYIYYVLGLGESEGEIRIIKNPAKKIIPDEKSFDIKLSRHLADEIIPLIKKD